MRRVLFLLVLPIIIFAKPIILEKNVNFHKILPFSSIYIDYSKSKSLKAVESSKFKPIDSKALAFGYDPGFDVWIKFELVNLTDKRVEKIVEYANALTSYIEFYDPKNHTIKRDGLFDMNLSRKSVNPIFKVTLEPKERRTFYIKASSYITTLIIKLKLWDSDTFFEKELKHQIFLTFFFGAMLVLTLYNLFIYFFTKDRSYLFYVLYMIGIINHHLVYVGIAGTYLLNQTWMIYIIEFAAILVAFPVLGLALFTKSFLQTYKYPIYNKLINFFILLLPFSILFFSITSSYNKYRNLVSILLLVLLMATTIYAAIRKNNQAYYILFAWIIFLTSGIMMYLTSLGVIDVNKYFPYFVEVSLVVEGIIFSVALAHRINTLKKEKEDANYKLIKQQENEKQRLEIKVTEKTADLETALEEKGLLLKELNHRVKNNMQTIISLIRLQADEIEDFKTKEIFKTIQNRLNAMSHLHELLYTQENISYVNAYEYFHILISELKDSYSNEININFDINTKLKMEQAIYCGLILNEVVTNSFKYAFPDKKGNMHIFLEKDNGKYKLYITDDGIGFDKSKARNSLGLILVDTLVKNQLGGEIITDTKDGVKTYINWRDE